MFIVPIAGPFLKYTQGNKKVFKTVFTSDVNSNRLPFVP